jgi:hypothetical protein
LMGVRVLGSLKETQPFADSLEQLG